ncbi:beta-N-acetylhexosaminidase [Marinicellulosiphila megalodicopiae]|uniref:beta-N-acetylhexosaminidase n=1 Tax=Marinicellulosiphila megalodicopiae TaxID=2724896 RepID=UPI003BAF1558
MKIFISLFIILFTSNLLAKTTLNILPKPQVSNVDINTKIDINSIQQWVLFSKSFPQIAQHFNDFFQQENLTLVDAKNSNIQLKQQIIVLLKNNKLLDEEYLIHIDQDIVIEAATQKGAYYALQSFKQLLMNDQLYKLEIQDFPTQSWRGNMIDVARHFRSKEYIKRHIELMGHYKLNRLHLHLSDDQGFRIEIKAFSKLTDISGNTSVYNDPAGFYSQADILELVSFANSHHVMIIPEIDLPAHTRSITHAYPNLACLNDDTQKYSGTHVLKTKLCLQKMDQVLPFLLTIFDEIMPLFDSKFVHIGADEVVLTKGLEAEETMLLHNLYQTLITHINQNNKTVIAWEEILNFNLKGDFIAQLWSGKSEFLTQARHSKTPIILSLCKHAYFDHGYYNGHPKMATWCNKDGVTLQNAFEMPFYSDLNILGLESALWGELVRTDQRADLRLWPRLFATAESSWTDSTKLEFNDFKNRVNLQLPFLKTMNVDYFSDY